MAGRFTSIVGFERVTTGGDRSGRRRARSADGGQRRRTTHVTTHHTEAGPRASASPVGPGPGAGPATVDCAVVIVTYNNARDIDGLLDSLPAAADGLTLRTIVVDNRSADDTVDRVGRHPGVQVIDAGANLGYAAAVNRGRIAARPCRTVLILNPDLRVE